MDRPTALQAARLGAPAHPFDVRMLELRGIRWLLARLFGNPPPWAYALLRRWQPVLRVFGWRYPKSKALAWLPLPVWRRWAVVTRREDVLEILENDADFNVWWGDDIRLLNDGRAGGTPFILGLDGGVPADRAEYERELRNVMLAFRRTDVAETVAPLAAEVAQKTLEESRAGKPFDAVQDLMLPVFFDTCDRYFGMPVPPETRHEFYLWSVAASGLLFGPPFERDRQIETAQAGAERMAEHVEVAIDAALGRHAPEAPTVLDRLADGHRRGLIGRPEIRAMLLGMIVGSVPTNAVAASHILDRLLDDPEMLDACRDAAASGDDLWLSRCLFEVMRFWPLNPGPWRRCAREVVIGRGTSHETRLRAGTIVLASTQSAMMDGTGVREPRAFRPGRDPADGLMFGHGRHWCVGRYIADAQVTQAFKPLLFKPGLRRAPGRDGRLDFVGLFPLHLRVVWDR